MLEEPLALLNQASGSLGAGKMGMLGCSPGLLGPLWNTFFLDLCLCPVRMGCVPHPPAAPSEVAGPFGGSSAVGQRAGGGSQEIVQALCFLQSPATCVLPHASPWPRGNA